MNVSIPEYLLADIDEYLRLRVIPESEFPGQKSIALVNLVGHIGERLAGIVCASRVESSASPQLSKNILIVDNISDKPSASPQVTPREEHVCKPSCHNPCLLEEK